MQTPQSPSQPPWAPPPRHNSSGTLALPPPLRAFMQDELMRTLLVLVVIVIIGLIVLARMVTNLTPPGIPAAGLPNAAHVAPALQDTPSRVQMNGALLIVTLRATSTRVDAGYQVTRYVFIATPPNDPPYTLCDGQDTTCALALDGTRRQAGTWIITLRAYDNTGGFAETRTRMRVT